ncbi:MAG: hypothetical protein ACK4TA_03185, partial [Saprospiraceae bacterium]
MPYYKFKMSDKMLLIAIISLNILSACSHDSVQETPTIVDRTDTLPAQDTIMPPTSAGTLHYLALGDSYTIGESVPYEARYPVQLVHQLRQKNIIIAEPQIIAR